MEVSGTNKLILPKDIILADRERGKNNCLLWPSFNGT